MSESNLGDSGYRIIRLVNGERLIAKVSGTTKTKLVLHRPMTIRGMTTNNPKIGITKEFIILTDWLEYCKEDHVRVNMESVLTISEPDDFVVEAYDVQKEYNDTGKVDSKMEDLPSQGTTNSMSISDLLKMEREGEEAFEELNGESLKSFLEEFVEGIINRASSELDEEDEEWFEEDVDKDRSDYGNDYDDWSPYPDDYL